MNYKIAILSTLILLFSIQGFSKQQETFHPDTIRMQMPNGTTIESRSNYNGKNDLSGNLHVNEMLGIFLKRWAVLNIKDLDPNKAILITCSKQKEYLDDNEDIISIEEIVAKTKIVFPVDKPAALVLRGKHKLELNSQLAIYFDTLDQLRELESYDFSKVLINIDLQMHEKPIWSLKGAPHVSWFNINNDHSTKLLHQRTVTPHNNVQINLSSGTSLENIKGNWNGSFYTVWTIQLGGKMGAKHAFTLGYEFMYDFSSGKQNVNHWVDLGYSPNTSLNPNKPRWYFLSVGYLATQAGDLFKEDSFRIGVNKQINKHVSIVPQIYFNDFFKNATPGFKIRINF